MAAPSWEESGRAGGRGRPCRLLCGRTAPRPRGVRPGGRALSSGGLGIGFIQRVGFDAVGRDPGAPLGADARPLPLEKAILAESAPDAGAGPSLAAIARGATPQCDPGGSVPGPPRAAWPRRAAPGA